MEVEKREHEERRDREERGRVEQWLGGWEDELRVERELLAEREVELRREKWRYFEVCCFSVYYCYFNDILLINILTLFYSLFNCSFRSLVGSMWLVEGRGWI